MTIYTKINNIIIDKLQEISICDETLKEYFILIEKYIICPPEDNYEKHHILPKSLFPEYKKLKENSWNRVNLPYKDHLEAHRLLSVFIDDYKIKFAYYSMVNKFKKYLDISDEEYEKAKVHNKNYITAKDKNGNFYYISKNDPRYISGELVHNTVGQICVKDNNGNTMSTTINDPRYISGELVPICKGMICVKDNMGNYYSVSKNDPRYISGELVPISTGMVCVKDNDGNIIQISKNDPRYISGELQYLLKNRITVKDINGKTQSVYNDDPRYISGELIGVTSGKTMAKNLLTGKHEQVDNNDPRLISGELVGISHGMKFYNNGKINKCFYPSQVPTGWKLGRIKKQL